MKHCLRWSSETMWQWKNTWKMISNWFRVDGFDWQMMRRAAAEGTGVVVVVPDRRRRRHGDSSSFPALMLGMTVVVVVAAAVLATSPGSLFLLPGASAAVQTTVKNVQQQQQLRVKPQPSSSVASSGLPVPDLLESPDAKYDPKPKDIDAAALRLRLKGEFNLFEIFSHIDTPLASFFRFWSNQIDDSARKIIRFFLCVSDVESRNRISDADGCCISHGKMSYTWPEGYRRLPGSPSLYISIVFLIVFKYLHV